LWSRAGTKEKRKLVVEQVCRQEKMLMGTKALTQAKQVQWLNWEDVEKKKFSWKELWNMEERSIRFLIGATYDVLSTPQNLKLGKWRPAMFIMFRYCNSKAYFVRL